MSKYYYTDGQQQFGPFTLEELKTKAVTAQTKMWFEGMTDWKAARDIPELRVVFPEPRSTPLSESVAKGESSMIGRMDYWLLFGLLYWLVNDLFGFVLMRLFTHWYDSPVRFLIAFLNILFIFIPFVMAFSIKDSNLRMIAIITSVFLSAFILIRNIGWVTHLF